MTYPLLVLMFLSVFGGLLNLPEAFSGIRLPTEALAHWLEHTVTYATTVAFNVPLALVALAVAIVAILIANAIYAAEPLSRGNRDKLQASGETRVLFDLANAKLYWDEFYGGLIEQPFNRASKWFADQLDWAFWHDYVHNTVIRDGFNGMAAFLANPVDKGIVDAGFLAIGRGIEWISGRLRRTETGYVRTYAFTLLLGVVFVLLVILFPLIRQLLQR